MLGHNVIRVLFKKKTVQRICAYTAVKPQTGNLELLMKPNKCLCASPPRPPEKQRRYKKLWTCSMGSIGSSSLGHARVQQHSSPTESPRQSQLEHQELRIADERHLQQEAQTLRMSQEMEQKTLSARQQEQGNRSLAGAPHIAFIGTHWPENSSFFRDKAKFDPWRNLFRNPYLYDSTSIALQSTELT